MTPIYDDDDAPERNNRNLITASATSMADYFKQKMQAKLGIPSTLNENRRDDDVVASGVDVERRAGIGGGSKGLGWAAAAPAVQETSVEAGVVEAGMRQAGESDCTDGKRRRKGRAVEGAGDDTKERKKRRME